jgi:hypothetical protein
LEKEGGSRSAGREAGRQAAIEKCRITDSLNSEKNSAMQSIEHDFFLKKLIKMTGAL